MTDTIKLDTGLKRIRVETTDGLTHDLVFNPNDVLFIERLHKLYQDARLKVIELEKYQEEMPEPELDENGIPEDLSPISDKTRELNNWFRGEIDKLLGENTCKAIFGDVVYYGESFGIYVQLITKLNSFIEPVRMKKIEKYVKK